MVGKILGKPIIKVFRKVNWKRFQLTFFVFKKWQKKCWGCGSLQVIRWGKREGHQRFKCKSCGLLFTRTNKGVRQSNEFIWFTKWVLGRRTFNDLVTESGYSKSTLQRHFKVYLSKPPRFIIRHKTRLELVLAVHYVWYYITTVLIDMHFTSVIQPMNFIRN